MQRINERTTERVNLEGFRPPRSLGSGDIEIEPAANREERAQAAGAELRLLLIEDSDRDAAHIALVLRRAGTKAVLTRVETREEMVAALASQRFDAVISDYHLPRFSAPEALEVLGASGIDLPFIVVSGAVGEDTAVELMRAGASDYVLKDRLARLAAAVDREIQQAQERRSKRRAETLFHAVIRASPDASVLVDRENLTIVDGSLSFQRQFLGPDEAVTKGTPLFSVANFSQPERITQLIERGKGTAWYVVYYADVVARVANIRCHTVEHAGVGYAYLVIEDVTEQHYLKAAFDAVEDAVLIIGSEQRLLYANRSAETLFGNVYFQTDVEPILQQVSPEPRWWQKAAGRFDERRVEIEGQPYEARAVNFRFAGEDEASTILMLHNVSEEAELLRLATHDALTGTYNVRFFADAVAAQIESARTGTGCVLALLDLDHFKPINDELGHAAGDAALITFASIVRSTITPNEIFARIGGDEFALLFPGRSIEEAKLAVQQIYERLGRTPLRVGELTRPLSASCGIASISPSDTSADLRARADRALYEAKRAGRGRYVVSD